MRYRIVDADGDYSFGSGQQSLTYGVYAVSQAIRTRLLLLKGEWWENLEAGTALYQEILGKTGSENRIMIADSIIKDRIANTKDVLSIKNFSSSLVNRQYSFSCLVITKYGEITLNNMELN